MKLRDDLEKKILIEVCKHLHDGHVFSVENGKNSQEVLEGDTWFDVHDETTGEIYSINIDYGWSAEDDPHLSITVFPVEKYIDGDGEEKLREITDGDCAVLL
tara:strand:+ start:135 stop:440 length:306 start_codon:yes stop_codon:yes gene_type:complete